MTARHILGTAALATALTLAAACGGKGKGAGKGDLVVTSHSPAPARIDLAEPIQLQFDKPVAGEGEVGVPLAAPPLSIHPAVPITAQWADRQTLVVTPKAPLLSSTRYRVELTGVLDKRTGGFT